MKLNNTLKLNKFVFDYQNLNEDYNSLYITLHPVISDNQKQTDILKKIFRKINKEFKSILYMYCIETGNLAHNPLHMHIVIFLESNIQINYFINYLKKICFFTKSKVNIELLDMSALKSEEKINERNNTTYEFSIRHSRTTLINRLWVEVLHNLNITDLQKLSNYHKKAITVSTNGTKSSTVEYFLSNYERYISSNRYKSIALESIYKKQDEIRPQHEIDLTTQYLSECENFGHEFNKILQDKPKILLHGSTGLGKTRFISDWSKNKKCLILVPFKALIQTFKGDHIIHLENTSEVKDFTNSVSPTSTSSVVCVTNQFQNLQSLNYFDYVILDEQHLSTREFRSDIHSKIIEYMANSSKRCILLSGTPTKINEFDILKVNYNENFMKKLKVHELISTDQIIEIVNKSNKTSLIYVDSKNKAKGLAKKFATEGVTNIIYTTSESTKISKNEEFSTFEFKHMNENEKYLIIGTTKLLQGLNIPNLENLFVLNSLFYGFEDLLQFLGRIRNEGGNFFHCNVRSDKGNEASALVKNIIKHRDCFRQYLKTYNSNIELIY